MCLLQLYMLESVSRASYSARWVSFDLNRESLSDTRMWTKSGDAASAVAPHADPARQCQAGAGRVMSPLPLEGHTISTAPLLLFAPHSQSPVVVQCRSAAMLANMSLPHNGGMSEPSKEMSFSNAQDWDDTDPAIPCSMENLPPIVGNIPWKALRSTLLGHGLHGPDSHLPDDVLSLAAVNLLKLQAEEVVAPEEWYEAIRTADAAAPMSVDGTLQGTRMPLSLEKISSPESIAASNIETDGNRRGGAALDLGSQLASKAGVLGMFGPGGVVGSESGSFSSLGSYASGLDSEPSGSSSDALSTASDLSRVFASFFSAAHVKRLVSLVERTDG